MTATQSERLYQILQQHFGQNENAAKAVSAIEAILDEKIETGNKRYEELLHKDLQILRSEMDKKLEGLRVEMREQKSEIPSTGLSLAKQT